MNKRTFAQKLKMTQQNTSVKSATPGIVRLAQNLEANSILYLQRTIGNKTAHRWLTREPTHILQQRGPTQGQLSMVVQREEAPPRQFGLDDGRIVANNFQVENSPWPGNQERARQTAWLELTFVPTRGHRFAAPGSINWFQSVRTNSRGGSEPVRPEDEYPIHPPVEFVDGYRDRGPDRQIAQFWNDPSFTFRDLPGRDNLPDRITTWQAETSCVGITAQRNERLITFSWGFTIDQRGRGQETPLTTTNSPSSYHMQKFGELPRQGP